MTTRHSTASGAQGRGSKGDLFREKPSLRSSCPTGRSVNCQARGGRREREDGKGLQDVRYFPRPDTSQRPRKPGKQFRSREDDGDNVLRNE